MSQLKRKSTNELYNTDYALRRTLRPVLRDPPKDRENVANDEDREKKEIVPSQLVDTMRARRNISNFLDRGNYSRLKHVKRDKFKPSGVAPGLMSRREQNKDKQSLIDLDRWVVKPRKKKGTGKRRRKKKRRTRKRRRTKKKRKRRRRKRRRTRK